MALQLSEEWKTLERSIRTTSEVIQQRGLEYGRHYLSLNALAVLWAWRYLTDRWAGARTLREVAKDEWNKQLAAKFCPLADRWLVCSQWAGYWGASSVQRVADLASKLATLRTTTDSVVDPAAAVGTFTALLQEVVGETSTEATGHIDRLSVDDRNQVRQYFTPLWIWHRLNDVRWAMSAVPLRMGRKQPTLDVDHVVAVKLWEKLTPSPTKEAAATDEAPQSGLNELGNCLLLETAFNISKSATPLGEWLKNVHEFKNGELKLAEWSAALGLPAQLLDPAGSTDKDVVDAVDIRTASIKQELKDFSGGTKTRADI
jgi:hypothetical protein